MWEGSVERNCEPMDKNRIEGVAEQGERAIYATAVLHHATILTQDAHFEGLAQVKYFAKTSSDRT